MTGERLRYRVTLRDGRVFIVWARSDLDAQTKAEQMAERLADQLYKHRRRERTLQWGRPGL